MLKAVLLAIFGGLIIVDSGPTSLPPLVASFTARPLQGGTCVAPCTVSFDAVGYGKLSSPEYTGAETTDNSVNSPFHQDYFSWDFDDNSSSSCGGLDAVWANSGQPKATANGGLAGHTYCAAGTYNPVLTVRNPSGDTGTATTTITVVDPAVEFTTAETWCFVDSGSDFTGCPLDTNADGTCDGADADHCILNSNLNTAISSNTDTVGCNADAVKARCMFKAGDTFTATNGLGLLASNASPGLIEKFGSGANPVFDMGSNSLVPAESWTFSGIDVRSSASPQALLIRAGYHHMTMYNMVVTQTGLERECLQMDTVSDSTMPYLIGLIEWTCTVDPATATLSDTLMWPMIRYLVWQGGGVDRQGTGPRPDGNRYTMRSIHQQHWILQHTLWTGTISGQMMEFRGEDGPRLPTNAYSNRYVLVSDNVLEPSGSQITMFQTCADSGCNCRNDPTPDGSSAGCDGQNQSGTIVDVGNYIFERNLVRYQTATAATLSAMFDLEGGNISVRNNVIDYKTALNTQNAYLAYVYGEVASWDGSTASSGIHILNNTVNITTSGYTGDVYLVFNNAGGGASGCTSDCLAYGNLVVVPSLGAGGSLNQVLGGAFTTSNNTTDSDGTDPFDGTLPATPTFSDFICSTGTTSNCLDAGRDFTSSDSDVYLWDDARGLRRPDSTQWDAGAVERGALAW